MRKFMSTCILFGTLAIAPGAFGEEASLDIPSDLMSLSNTASFITTEIARDCDAKISVYQHVRHDSCDIFLAQSTHWHQRWDEGKARWSALTKQVTRSPSYVVQVNWKFFLQQFQLDLDQMTRTMEHISFYQNLGKKPSASTAKKAK